MNMPHIAAGAVIYVKDLARLAKFYEIVSDLKVREIDNSHIRLESDAFQLVILQVPKRIANSIEICEPPLPRENTAIKLVFFVESISAARDRIRALGGDLNASEKEWKYGSHTVCDGHDPEGNIFQLRQV